MFQFVTTTKLKIFLTPFGVEDFCIFFFVSRLVVGTRPWIDLYIAEGFLLVFTHTQDADTRSAPVDKTGRDF